MKKKILLLMGVFAFGLLQAQVGINTQNPLGWFHIDPQGNTGGTAIAPTSDNDDVIITTTGNMGIGTANPQAKLHIVSPTIGEGFQMQDGTQHQGRVLTSDLNGRGRWIATGSTEAVMGDLGTVSRPIRNGIRVRASDVDRIAYSGMSITLNPGDYLVNFTLWFGAAGAAVEMDDIVSDKFASIFFSTSDTEHIPPIYITDIKSIIVPGLFHRAKKLDYYGSGGIPIRITGQRTTLYLWAYIRSFNYKPANATFPDANPDSNRQIRFDILTPGSFGPYTQLYAIPFITE